MLCSYTGAQSKHSHTHFHARVHVHLHSHSHTQTHIHTHNTGDAVSEWTVVRGKRGNRKRRWLQKVQEEEEVKEKERKLQEERDQRTAQQQKRRSKRQRWRQKRRAAKKREKRRKWKGRRRRRNRKRWGNRFRLRKKTNGVYVGQGCGEKAQAGKVLGRLEPEFVSIFDDYKRGGDYQLFKTTLRTQVYKDAHDRKGLIKKSVWVLVRGRWKYLSSLEDVPDAMAYAAEDVRYDHASTPRFQRKRRESLRSRRRTRAKPVKRKTGEVRSYFVFRSQTQRISTPVSSCDNLESSLHVSDLRSSGTRACLQHHPR